MIIYIYSPTRSATYDKITRYQISISLPERIRYVVQVLHSIEKQLPSSAPRSGDSYLVSRNFNIGMYSCMLHGNWTHSPIVRQAACTTSDPKLFVVGDCLVVIERLY
jgi:hypothetical protein